MDFQADVSTHLFEVKQALVDLCGGELVVLEGPDSGVRVSLGPITLRVGTASGSQLRLSDPTVSRLHCQFVPRRDGFRLVDVGSTNGTFVDGVRVRDADLLASTTVRLGASVLRLELGAEPVRVALSKQRSFGRILGGSIEMRRLYAILERVAPSDATVLIQGETGTGKELIARAIHQLSPRRNGPFVRVNCAAIPLGLLESELFGHEKGAFTGALAQKIGRFELAHQGTLFLDEVGDIPLELQPKLLRVVQEQEFERLGSTRTQRVDVRLVAATNRNLEEMVGDKQFREDLYFRLNVFPIRIPPLRERAGDIPLLVRHFVDKYAQRMNKQIETIPEEAMAALCRYSWPGNIRELQNFIERAVILTPGSVLQIQIDELQSSRPIASTVSGTLEDVERQRILEALRETGAVIGGQQGAAARLGLKRTTLLSKMQKLGISRYTKYSSFAGPGILTAMVSFFSAVV